MKIRCENGLYTAVANDGRVVDFVDRNEAVACAKEHQGIMRLLGHDKPLEAYIPSEKKAAPEPAPVKAEKKIVRIRIDTDVEHIGMRGDTSSVAPKVRHLSRCGSVTPRGRESTGLSFNTSAPLRYPLEKAKEKALA